MFDLLYLLNIHRQYNLNNYIFSVEQMLEQMLDIHGTHP